jgi:hypothetical protein
MEADLQTHRAFYLTGKKLSAQLDAVDGLGLRPALFSSYRDLSTLRYDYPLVLADGGIDALSAIVDRVLAKIARGETGERIRKHLLRLEREIRSLVKGGAQGRLSVLWEQAAAPLCKSDALIADSLKQARANLAVDGEVIDCDAALAFRLVGHAWEITHAQRGKAFAAEVERLLLKLSDVIKADFNSSSAGKSATSLKAAFGSGPLDAFDFTAMSQLLAKSAKIETLTAARRARIESLIATISAQKFFATRQNTAPHAFVFDSCRAALAAYRERLPAMVALSRALTVADLEIRGEYSAAKHDALFASFGENGLDANELARFPDYLVRIAAKDLVGEEHDALHEILAIELPIKVVVQTDDVIEASPLEMGHLAFSLQSRQLAMSALANQGAYVLQAPSASLYALREAVQRGVAYAGPALYSVFSGAGSVLPAYLVGAAALEARAFPAFVFDPAAGDDWASRFSLAGNPQLDADWPTHAFAYEDETCQTVKEDLAFTLVDFVACDPRYAAHFARVPKARWHDELVAVDAALATTGAQFESVPCVLMVDPDNKLQRVITDEKLVREARRCRANWRSLQELGGINNSHAAKLVASEKKAWQEAAAATAPAAEASPASAEPVAAVAAAPAPAAVEAAPARSPDEAYIETPRCSTCNECVQLNGKMFAYDGNQQAYIADVSAGTYAQLVQAAENCQVAIIHPGKPRNPNEPGLEDLMKRAEAFM